MAVLQVRLVNGGSMNSKPFWEGKLDTRIGGHSTMRSYKRTQHLDGTVTYWRQDVYTKMWGRIPTTQMHLIRRIDAAANKGLAVPDARQSQDA